MKKNNNDTSHLMYQNIYKIDIVNFILFELRAVAGKFLLNSKPPLIANSSKLKLLNLGCGRTRFKGWVNADFYDFTNVLLNNGKAPDWMIDLRRKLNCADGYWDGVYCEHTLEHLYPDDQLNLLRELYRTMVKGATIRIIVPDLEKYIRYYSGVNNDESFASRWTLRGESIWSLTQNWLHLSVWDFELLKRSLEMVGFKDIRKLSYSKGSNRLLIKDLKDRAWESLYVEAKK